jgi:hypothetical protein
MNALKRVAPAAVLLLSATLLAACAGTPGPGEAGYPFNVTGSYSGDLMLEGAGLGATMSLETGAGGVVTGTVRVSEMGIAATAEGTLVGDQLVLRISYKNPGTGCDGVAEVTATVTEGGAAIAGPMAVRECGQAMGGSARFRR